MLRYHQIGKRSCSSSSPEHTDPSRVWARGHLRFANLGSLCAIPPGRCWRHTRHKQRGARLRKVAYRILTRTRLRCSIPGSAGTSGVSDGMGLGSSVQFVMLNLSVFALFPPQQAPCFCANSKISVQAKPGEPGISLNVCRGHCCFQRDVSYSTTILNHRDLTAICLPAWRLKC